LDFEAARTGSWDLERGLSEVVKVLLELAEALLVVEVEVLRVEAGSLGVEMVVEGMS
jgi:hypothetical protein